MIALLKKEISVFFSTLIGYLIIGVFLLINSILLWSDFSKMNILEYGYADMDIFFSIAPLLFLLFIPAISMRIFTEEYTSGTMETLITKPITAFNIVLGKFLAIFTLVLFAIIPTLIYVVNIYYLGEIIGNLDLAGIIGSYIGLIFLCSLFSSVSVYASSIVGNQIISFLLAILLNTLFYFGFDLLSEISLLQNIDLIIQQIGVSFHYDSMSKGLIKFSDVVYFTSFTFLFIKLTELVIIDKKA
ncbi:ABC transporter permease subunit [Flavobacteriales bacterium]|jgi:ABC-2 type transport system permease protein|nr:ABC transporter permease subunit [Flavobacteriales bacterium]MDC3305400.1 ABC transporter permease subunit [Flavobacteriales bacterium]MDC3394769.1 ABC transporter permease subunit [Flavobacteriales bacterium]